jgi:hypothetical protein
MPLIVAIVCLWRWRWELNCLAAFAIVYRHLVTAEGLNLGPVAAFLIMIAPSPVVMVVRPLREFIRDRIWCVTTRHRVRACLTEMRVLNWSGNLPFIIGCFSTTTGEVVWLWMRAGLSIEDLEANAETLASACWARHAIVDRTHRNAALLRIEIVRRPRPHTNLASPSPATTTHGPRDGRLEIPQRPHHAGDIRYQMSRKNRSHRQASAGAEYGHSQSQPRRDDPANQDL